MSSSYSSTYSSTYTVADVEKVVRSIKADLIMIASSTRAMTEDKAKQYAHDIELLAKNNYLSQVDVTLMSSNGSEKKAVQYVFQTEDASGTERPGGVMWPHTPDGWVRIILSYTDSYFKESANVSKLSFEINWVSTTASTTHSNLTGSGNRGYSSNGFGANRSDYS
ncbi:MULTISPECIES: HORMA-1 domain-containing protein [Acinetobacter]|jgi:hypothetical protein|uniref:Bacterial HORMA domain-containing protein n=1 Tax=Acinetobacter corruptisaponis TaxID=3045147 RepID=A0ABY8S6W3_9GAMM|nr:MULTISPECIES: hypothetical protein [Acinetobacter]WHP06232.1 hypothetical protein QLH32_01795 [Acinetobacter sp. KCTC 92772]WPO65978.1 hypothetical protein SDC64_08460 [Acinetobacter haemolyticus]